MSQLRYNTIVSRNSCTDVWNINLGQSRLTHFKKASFVKIPESTFCDRRWWRWTAFFRLKIEIFQYKKRMPEDRVRQHSSVYVESMTRMRDLFNSTISSTLSEFFSPLALSLITELFLFLSHFVTFWFQLRRFITDIFKCDERKQVVADSLVVLIEKIHNWHL